MIEPNGPTTVDPVIITYQLVINACKVNQVFVQVPQNDLTYYIGQGPEFILDGFGSQQENCAIQYSLVEEGKNAYDFSIFSFSSLSPMIKIDTDRASLHLEDVTLILKATSVDSGSVATQIFTVTFQD